MESFHVLARIQATIGPYHLGGSEHTSKTKETPAMYVDLSVVRGAGVVLLVVAVAAAILWKMLVERWRSGL